ncbi:bifunctional UDP-N-acetylmuramoyl-tripeptide:D-alanyl-D-alanine ligase/alanine racemase [Aridibaculum aurantiacum]|uniref:bifunctional UDP-N-acetylmuramoyl-tripeptide:D-alanyl-D-alanine ligase/alanine racemase n=1 Tax=Aridibaculum aurantiacum TaxID=2810307 RepID=UPI001A97B5DC|nr:bifunctional UDP-N-acetylmuramoyl-tripeptide:D-alanyl-D-alanine ligase/alanine racemase [Aridibaculum aurantiacum]
MYPISTIAEVLNARSVLAEPGTAIEHLLTDSRRLVMAAATLFFGIETSRRNGSDFVSELYAAGVRNFVVKNEFDPSPFPLANFVYVDDPLVALQQLVAWHRRHFNLPVIGITGSNGKTIVKEWLYQLLYADQNIVRSPKSFNSQVGVPLSVWQLNEQHTLAIFEAGISMPGEMSVLENIIKPTIGVLTNIGEAHGANFASKQEKLQEKFQLFAGAKMIACNNGDALIENYLHEHQEANVFTWGYKGKDLRLLSVEKKGNQSLLVAEYKNAEVSITIPFSDNASIENAISCWCILLLMGVPNEVISRRMQLLQPVEMRLQMKRGINNCSIINDSYSNDISSLNIALDFLQQQAGKQKATVILSDLGESGHAVKQYSKVAAALLRYKIDKFVGIGNDLCSFESLFSGLPDRHFFRSVEEFKQQLPLITFRDEVILVKGARVFEFEQIGSLFEQQVHQTVMEVNLSAMVNNLKQFHQYLKPTTKVMAMVKAFSYGSGSAEVASVLQYHKVDYLAVAYADEGVELRKAGIHMPVMVMNPEDVTFPVLLQYNLEPEMYSLDLLNSFCSYVEKQGVEQVGIHIKLDTGMHRLGFEHEDVEELLAYLQAHKTLVVKSVFSHLVGSEEQEHDAFTQYQGKTFNGFVQRLKQVIDYPFITHISNSAAIFRHPNMQYDMVRLGIGLYGIDTSASNVLQLQPVATLRTTISQIRKVKAGESVGYSRKGMLQKDATIATIRIGYADGFRRKLGNGNGKVFLKGATAPVVGNVCMDMTMIDVSDIEDVKEGDAVEIFGPNLPVEQLAKWCETIPYEIMTNISLRVKRVYYEE